MLVEMLLCFTSPEGICAAVGAATNANVTDNRQNTRKTHLFSLQEQLLQ